MSPILKIVLFLLLIAGNLYFMHRAETEKRWASAVLSLLAVLACCVVVAINLVELSK